jgi:purine-binding chemotaxis protein CheW
MDTPHHRHETEILLQRARILAQPEKREEDLGESIEVLSFLLNGERYGVCMDYVKEVTLLRSLTTLPGTPDFILGVMSIRGRVVSITDLRVFFHMPRKGLSDYNKIIVLSGEEMEFAILADHVEGVARYYKEALASARDFQWNWKGISHRHIPGPLIMLNAKAILSHPYLVVTRADRKIKNKADV